MNDVTDLKMAFAAMKARAKVKEFGDRPQSPVEYGDHILTYCIEKTPFGLQPVLAVSRIDGGVIGELPEEFHAIVEVFGPPIFAMDTSYPRRGDTRLFIWREQ